MPEVAPDVTPFGTTGVVCCVCVCARVYKLAHVLLHEK